MEKNYTAEELTYVLFGAEAIQVYDISINMLLSSEQLTYNVGAYNILKEFIDESKKWDDFIEINHTEYVALEKRMVEKKLKISNNSKDRKKPSFFNFFK